MKRIEAEFRRAEHLLYVSLKYTKTADVIRNVLDRWRSTIEMCIERLLMRAKRTKKIKVIPTAPLAMAELIPTIYKDKIVKEILELYYFFRRLKSLEQMRVCEFRKHVALLVIDGKKEINIDIPKLYEWNQKIAIFLEYVKEKV
ncbi:MAG: hypothetical protein KJ767_03305 [Nanoarchaeota archaeon]|nr:hypothetical protein [Nanoarchaeota archaeon]